MESTARIQKTTFVPDHAGEWYGAVLARLHQVLRPSTYLEIGVSAGATLRLASCPAIAVDPELHITSDVIGTKSKCLFYQMPSDRFFEENSPTQIFGRPVDLAFVDGMHHAEFLLRDFINIEHHSKPNSVILIHDCLPTDLYIAERVSDTERRRKLSTKPEWWTGDVWKVPLILQKYRPDLKICAFDAPPTGLIIVTALDPHSKILQDSYFKIVDELQNLDLLDYGIDNLFTQLNVLPTRRLSTAQEIGQFFWL